LEISKAKFLKGRRKKERNNMLTEGIKDTTEI
jgi:hypothetical protein